MSVALLTRRAVGSTVGLGIFMMFFGDFMFAVNDIMGKWLAGTFSAGQIVLTRSLAAEWGSRGVRVNTVAPTYIDTEMNKYVYEDAEMYKHWVGGTPMNRLGRTDEVASVILFLASEAASLMTGSIVLADGGYVCW